VKGAAFPPSSKRSINVILVLLAGSERRVRAIILS